MDERVLDSFSTSAQVDALCPTSGAVCPAKLSLVEDFVSETDPRIAAQLPPDMNPVHDRIKLRARLAEYAIVANTIGCAGASDSVCPTRVAMDESRIRRGLAHTVRKALTFWKTS